MTLILRLLGDHQPIARPSMASAVFSKPYRFILVSDLDWTMVSAICSHATHQCNAGWAA